MKTWLLLDANNLCWRAFHTTGQLSHKGSGTGIIYGVLRDILNFQEIHDTQRIAFCFDSKSYLRTLSYPGYKSSRKDKEYTEEEQASFREVHRQKNELRKVILPGLGYRNVFMEKGYEADDLIASICAGLSREEKAVIVSSDHDLYQLLSERVCIWNPTANKTITDQSFSKEYGVSPLQWVDVKAIAGCSSDDVKGIVGVGEKTAAKFINGTLKSSSKAFDKIVKGNKIWTKNRAIVKLPFAGCPKLVLTKDKLDKKEWDSLAKRLGMKSLRHGFGIRKGDHGEEETKAKKPRKGRKLRKGFVP